MHLCTGGGVPCDLHGKWASAARGGEARSRRPWCLGNLSGGLPSPRGAGKVATPWPVRFPSERAVIAEEAFPPAGAYLLRHRRREAADTVTA